MATGESTMLGLKVLPQAEAKAVFEPLTEIGKQDKTPKACATPKVTLQKQGDVVSSIRIECACGQVIELACAY
jgi:hypothetical protein